MQEVAHEQGNTHGKEAHMLEVAGTQSVTHAITHFACMVCTLRAMTYKHQWLQ